MKLRGSVGATEAAQYLGVSKGWVSNLWGPTTSVHGVPLQHCVVRKREVSDSEIVETMPYQIAFRGPQGKGGRYYVLDSNELRRFLQCTSGPLSPGRNECIRWIGEGRTTSKGHCHGSFGQGTAHVFAYCNFVAVLLLEHGLLGHSGLYVLHRCDSDGRCVNPRHLYVGTLAQNAKDKIAHRLGAVLVDTPAMRKPKIEALYGTMSPTEVAMRLHTTVNEVREVWDALTIAREQQDRMPLDEGRPIILVTTLSHQKV
jgi:hypothetical protein